MKVRELIKTAELPFEILAGKAGLGNAIKNDIVYLPELLLTGYPVKEGRSSIQILSNSALNYLKENPENLKYLLKARPPCIIIPEDSYPSGKLVKICDGHKIPLLKTSLGVYDIRDRIEYLLEREFAPHTHIHGTLIDVYGMGVLIRGQSGIGKTEWALDLVFKGHRLVTDDVVKVIKTRDGRLEGSGIERSEKLKYHIEIRGIGILDLKSMLGIRGIRERKAIELIVTLYEGRCETLTEITGIETRTCKILDVNLPEIHIPVTSGKNISSLVEVIALNKLLQLSGINSAKRFDSELIKVMKKNTKGNDIILGRKQKKTKREKNGKGNNPDGI